MAENTIISECFTFAGCYGKSNIYFFTQNRKHPYMKLASHSLTGALGTVTHTNVLLTLYLYKTIQQLQQLQQQQNLNLQQFVLVQPGHHIATQLQPAQFIISQTPQGQQSESSVVLTFLDLSVPPCDQPI